MSLDGTPAKFLARAVKSFLTFTICFRQIRHRPAAPCLRASPVERRTSDFHVVERVRGFREFDFRDPVHFERRRSAEKRPTTVGRGRQGWSRKSPIRYRFRLPPVNAGNLTSPFSNSSRFTRLSNPKKRTSILLSISC